MSTARSAVEFHDHRGRGRTSLPSLDQSPHYPHSLTGNLVRDGPLCVAFSHLATVYDVLVQKYCPMDKLSVPLLPLLKVIQQNDAFSRCATVYKRMMRTVRSAPEKYETDVSTAKRFEYLMQRLEGDLMDDMIFRNCVDLDFEHPGHETSVQNNSIFQAEFAKALQVYGMHLPRPGHRLVVTVTDTGGRGQRPKPTLCTEKDLQFRAPLINFIFSLRKVFF